MQESQQDPNEPEQQEQDQKPTIQAPEPTRNIFQKLRTKRFLIPAIVIVLLAVAGLLFLVLHKDSGTPVATVKLSDGSTKTLSFAETGYTGVAGDVISKQTFDCAPRNENEWYRSDRTFTIDYKNPDVMYVNVEFKGLYKTTDGGKTWVQKTKGIKVYGSKDNPSKGCYGEYPVIRMDPKNNQHLIVGVSGGGGGFLDATTPNSQTGGAYQTYDGGETWSLMINNHMDIYVTDLAFDPTNPKNIYYGTASNPASWQEADQTKLYVTKGIVYKTTTSAKNRDWTELSTGLGNHTGAQSILVNAQDSKQVNIPTFSALRESADGTGTGVSTGKDTSIAQMGILKTSDGGKTWTKTPLPDGNPPLIEGFACEADFSHQYFIHTSANYASFDAATTFKRSSMVMSTVAYDPFDPTCNHMLGYSTSVGTPTIPNLNLFESNDGGLTWQPHGKLPAEITDLNSTSTRPSLIAWHPSDKNTIFLAGGGAHIWKSTDFGNSWTMLLHYEQLK